MHCHFLLSAICLLPAIGFASIWDSTDNWFNENNDGLALGLPEPEYTEYMDEPLDLSFDPSLEDPSFLDPSLDPFDPLDGDISLDPFLDPFLDPLDPSFDTFEADISNEPFEIAGCSQWGNFQKSRLMRRDPPALCEAPVENQGEGGAIGGDLGIMWPTNDRIEELVAPKEKSSACNAITQGHFPWGVCNSDDIRKSRGLFDHIYEFQSRRFLLWNLKDVTFGRQSNLICVCKFRSVSRGSTLTCQNC